ncbi:MAG: fibronectin/fibrinogen-binding protein [Ruminococcaceae bacterium]|nr:fibronectin/fibrinogen-binding protein [Oscillospiraceae bacterium]
MAFDAGMLACTLSEIRKVAQGARIEKVYQPEKDEIVLQMRSFEGGKRLLINAGSNNPRINFSEIQKENPQNPPMFCVLLRKYLQGSKLTSIEQEDFDRIAYLGFDSRDEMGFECKRYLIIELMGKYSNLIFADGNKKIISALRTSDFSFDSLRQLIPGVTYTPPSSMGKINPKTVPEKDFYSLFESANSDKPIDKWIVGTFMGIAPVVAREIVLNASRRTDTLIGDCNKELLWKAFSNVAQIIREETFSPSIVLDGEKCVEYSFINITQYVSFEVKSFESAGKLLDAYFARRDNDIRVHQRASDILKLLSNAENRILKKIDLQRAELEACETGETYKKYGDLITANIYRLQKKASIAELEDYETMDDNGNFETVKITLDPRLSPAANAQKYYKKYAKTKNAKIELAKQISIAEQELEYIYTVFDALTRAESPADLAEIRDELYKSGYASRMKAYSGASHKQKAPAIMQFETIDGMKILCGKNNLQNEHITHKLAEKHDYWFHAKGTAGSHVLLVTEGKEPTDLDFTTAAEIAAYYSKAEGSNIGVDYTLAKNVKKTAGGRPGFVIYHTNWTAYVTPNGEKINSLRKK